MLIVGCSLLIGVADEADATTSGNCGSGVTYTLDTDAKTLTISGTGSMYDYSSGSGSQPPWYADKDSVGTITIGNGVTTIGNYAFYECTSLASITIPNTVTSIKNNAFRSCSSLGSITIPDSITTIGSYAFYQCTDLTTVILGNSITDIKYYAFQNCTDLTTIDIPDAVTSLGSSVFEGCTGLTTVNFNETSRLTSIGYSTFSGCTNLTSITIPDTVTSIGSGAFNSCSSLGTATIGNGLTKIPSNMFYNCTNLGTLTIGEGVTSIENYNAFSGCKQISMTILCNIWDNMFSKTDTGNPNLILSLTIGDKVTSIGINAFYECSSLKTVHFESNSVLTSIGNKAFANCSLLESIDLDNLNGLTSIGDDVFSSCVKLGSVVDKPVKIPGSVATIGARAFGWCSSLTTVNFLGSSLTAIKENTFNGCTALSSITIPNSVTSIGNYAFNNCTALRNLIVGNSVSSIGTGAFYNCHDVTVKVLGSINNDMFSSHTFFTGLVIANGVESIGTNAFLSCSSLTSVTIEENSGLKTIGDYAFKNCASLKSINLEKATGLMTIGGYTFAGCSTLGSVADKPVTIPSSVTTIGTYAFYGCDALKSVTIPASVETIETYAFSYCTSLEIVTITSGVKRISYGAFSNSPLKSLDIPSSVVTIENNAFNGIKFLDSNGNELDATVANLAGYTFTGTDGTTLTRSGSPTPTTYVVSYNSNGGSLSPVSETVNSGDSVTLPDPGTKTGYSFAGWYMSSSGGTRVGGHGDSYTPQSSITLYAHWTIGETYTVKFVNYDGAVLETHTNLVSGDIVTYGGNIPTRPDDGQYTYSFKGWSPEITVVTDNATYTATYDKTPIGDSGSSKGLDVNGQFLLVTFGAVLSLMALAMIVTKKRP